MTCRILLTIAFAVSLILLAAGAAWRLSHPMPVFNLMPK